MGKRNPYITTIGFNKDDPEHVQVAEFLNGIGRGKAAYIVKAVVFYQSYLQTEEVPGLENSSFDYAVIRKIVLQVLDEREGKGMAVEKDVFEKDVPREKDIFDEFDDGAVSNIMASLEAFQNQ